METYNTINNVLVNLFNDIWEIEKKAIITGQFKDLTINDMHVIEAIGPEEGDKMSVIAKKLGITVGSLTSAINSLVKKEYVIRERSESDRRVVKIKLTEKGLAAYYHHEDFHKKMVNSVIESLQDKEEALLIDSLKNLQVFFKNYGQQFEDDGNEE